MAKEVLVKIDTGKTLPLDYLKPLQGELKELSEESAKKLKASILKYGFIFPIFAWENPSDGDVYILDGHQRRVVLEDLRDKKYIIPQLPVVMIPAENIDDAKSKLASAASHFGEFTPGGIQSFFDSFKFDSSLFDTINIPTFEVPEFDEEKIQVAGYERDKMTYVEGEDEIPELAPIFAKADDVFILGDHRLMCGDSTDRTSVEILMSGKKADLLFTDPPYGVSYTGGHNKKKRDGIKGDTLEGESLTDLFSASLKNAYDFTEDHSAFYIWYANGKAVETYASFANLNLTVRAVLCWYKIKSGLGAFMSQYIPNYEPCIYAFKTGCSPQWFGPSTEKTVWELKREGKNEYHPTQKPVELPERAILNSSKENDIVLDLFGGSGSTLIAAEKLNRKCFMMELDPQYIGVIIERWEKFTGKEAVRLNPDGSKVEWSKIKNSKLKKK